jgi:exopolysaccharide biosynthesis polyprenyl glycosylphosphotransferase
MHRLRHMIMGIGAPAQRGVDSFGARNVKDELKLPSRHWRLGSQVAHSASALNETSPQALKWTGSKLSSLYALRRLLSILALLTLDAFSLLAGLILVGYLVGGSSRLEEILRLAPILVAMWTVIFAAHDLYDHASNRRNSVTWLRAILSGLGLLVIGDLLYAEFGLVLEEILVGALFVLPLEIGMRFLYEQGIDMLYRKKLCLVPILLIGEDKARRRVSWAMKQLAGSYTCVGELPSNDEGVDLRVLRQELDHTGAHQVIVIGAEHFPEAKFVEFLRACRLRRVGVKAVPSMVNLTGGSYHFSDEVGLPLLEVRYPQLDNTQRALKRVLDAAVSLLGLVLLSPLLLAVALAIRLDSPGPVLFRQKRVGADGRVFDFYKFRSMYEDAEQRQEELEAQNEAQGAVFKMREDPRITPAGRFLRRWSIDELPQLINVLKGEMSLVGPRPLPVRDFQRMEEEHKRRLEAVPGMTGYWQISGRSNLSFEEMVRLDLFYIENWSLSFDVKIILRTLGAVLRREGAH